MGGGVVWLGSREASPQQSVTKTPIHVWDPFLKEEGALSNQQAAIPMAASEPW
jgi:hypothetical protein